MEVPSILNNAADKCGLIRAKFIDKNTPTSMSNVCIFPFFGDTRSNFILSSLILKRFKEEYKNSKYFILCSWQGNSGLFPYVDEYWHFKPELANNLWNGIDGFDNKSEAALHLQRNLNHYFLETFNSQDIKPFYDNGITKAFFERFKHIKRFLPVLPSAAILGAEFNRDMNRKANNKVFIVPSKVVYGWKHGQINSIKIGREFWVELIKFLIKNGICPVLLKNNFCYDLSSDFTSDCIYVVEDDISNILAAIRSTGCLLDVFNGYSRMAIAARCPFVCIEERNKYAGLKEYEIDDLCGQNIPREYIFSFTTIINSDRSVWKVNLFDGLLAKIESVFSKSDRDSWPSTSETNEIIPYSNVREIKAKKFGMRFISVPKI